MSSVRIAIGLDDGSLAVMHFITRGRGPGLPHGGAWSDSPGHWTREPTLENIAQEIGRTFASGPQPVSWRIVADDEVPADRSFRNAWVDRDKQLQVDMPKARGIHLERLKRRRTVVLEELDRDFTRAQGQGSDVKEIERRRQAWRDMPTALAPVLEAAQTPEELKAIGFEV